MSAEPLTGRHLKIGALDIAPFTVFPPNPNVTEKFAGLCFDVFKTIAHRLNWTYNVVKPWDDAAGAPDGNGSWNGLVGMLIRKEIDAVVGPFTVTYARSQAVDFMYPFYEDPTGILIPPPREESKLWACAQPYATEVWLGLLACLVVLPILLWLILRISRNGLWYDGAPHQSLQLQFDFVIGCFLSQSGRCFVHTHPSRILAAVWCLASIILVNTYTSTLVSYLTVPRQKALVDSIDDVATKNVLTFSVMKSTSFASLMLSATSGTYKLLGDSLRRFPETRVPSLGNAVEKVLTGKYAYIMDKSILDDVIYQDYKKHPSCRLTLAKNSFYKSYVAFMLPKKSTLLKPVNLEITRLHEAGLIPYWAARSLPPPNPCVTMKLGVPNSENLNLNDLQSAFMIFSLGSLFALLVFMIESIFHYQVKTRFFCNLRSRCNGRKGETDMYK